MVLTKRPEDPEQIREQVSQGYARIAEARTSSCLEGSDCCGSLQPEQVALSLGYQAEELATLPSGANLGLGCGHPTAIASLKAGEVVIDLGSGAGIDVFLAAKQVGPSGQVIGIDMTDAMLKKARANARAGGYTNVEFRQGNIEQLPVDSASIDVIISNCVINLSPEKDRVFREAYRVLRAGGRMMISDIVLEKELPEEVSASIEAWAGCVGGASTRAAYLQTIRSAGFSEIRIEGETRFPAMASPDDPLVKRLSETLGFTSERAGQILSAITSLQLLVLK